MERTIAGLEDMRSVAHELVERLSPSTRATLITLSGELGAGKTTLSQMIGNELGIEESMVSPTFVLEKIYALSGKQFSHLVHIDAYRLEGGAELASLGFDELMHEKGNLILLEWPEKVADTLPQADVAVSISIHENATRALTITYAGE